MLWDEFGAKSLSPLHDTVLLGMVTASAMLVQQLLQFPAGTTLPLSILACVALAGPIVHFSRAAQISERVRSCCWMLITGYLGMLAGLMLDYPHGLLQALSLCRSVSIDFIYGVRYSITQMPLACAAMLAAGHCGEWLRRRLQHSDHARAFRLRSVLQLNTAMLAGMTLAHASTMDLGSELPVRWFGACLLLAMPAGMGFGMAVFATLDFQNKNGR